VLHSWGLSSAWAMRLPHRLHTDGRQRGQGGQRLFITGGGQRWRCTYRGSFASTGAPLLKGAPEDVLTPDTLRATYGSERLVFRSHGYALVANSPLACRGLHSDRLD
jgi:hypothetical protein